MTNKSDVIASAVAFRDALSKLAEQFTGPEAQGFTTLLLFYQDRLTAFQASPRYGDVSDYYQNPLHWSEIGISAAPQCETGNPASQQPVYDAANNGGDALELVTDTTSGAGAVKGVTGILSSFQGSLLN